MVNVLDGSRIDLGRKKRRNMKKHVARNAVMLVQTMRRRILLTAGSGLLSTTGPDGLATGGGAGFDVATDEGVATPALAGLGVLL